MIKSIVDLSLRLTDLMEAEGRLAKAHAVHFLLSALILGLAGMLAVGASLILGAAGLLALVAAGLSWPVALLAVAGGLFVTASAVGVFGWFVLNRQRPVTPSHVAAGAPASVAQPREPLPRGHAA